MASAKTARAFTRTSIADELIADLREAITGRRLAPGQPIQSVRKIADQYGIGPATVHRALDRLAEEGLVERRPRSGTFVSKRPQTPAGTLARVAFYLPMRITKRINLYHAQILLGAEGALADADWHLIFSTVRELAERKSPPLHAGYETPESGWILIGPVGSVLEKSIRTSGKPYVFVDHQPAMETVDAAFNDDASGINSAAERLVALGHRRIAYIGGLDWGEEGSVKPWPNSLLRQAAWRKAMRTAGLKLNDRWAIQVSGTAPGGGRDAFLKIRALRPRPTAVITFSDRQGAELVSAAREAGWRIPKDLSVVSFGIADSESRAAQQKLALLMPDPMALGRHAAELLIRRCRQPEAPAHRVVAPIRFAENATIGPVPKNA